MLLEYSEKHGIMKAIWRFLNIMFELFLVALENLIENPKIAIGAIIISAGTMLILRYRARYVFRRVYIERKLYFLVKENMHYFFGIMPLIICLTEFMTKASMEIYKDGKTHTWSFLLYYIPMLILIIFLRIGNIQRERDESIVKSLLWLMPGISIHILFLLFLVCGNKSPFVLGIILVSGVFVPTILDIGVLFIASPKDVKMCEVELENSDKYNVRLNDLLERKDEVYIRIRNEHREVEKTIVVKKEDISQKTIYTQKPDIKIQESIRKKIGNIKK